MTDRSVLLDFIMMTKKMLAGLAALILVLTTGCGDDYKTPADIKDHVAWLDFRSALPVFPFGTNYIYVYVNSDLSPECRYMNEHIFNRPEIIKYMNEHVTSISIVAEDVDTVTFLGEQYTARELFDMLDVTGLPSHFFFDPGGRLKGARTGYIGLREFKQLIRYIAEGYVERMDFASYLQRSGGDIDTVWGKF